jgi:hypothetical protein
MRFHKRLFASIDVLYLSSDFLLEAIKNLNGHVVVIF